MISLTSWHIFLNSLKGEYRSNDYFKVKWYAKMKMTFSFFSIILNFILSTLWSDRHRLSLEFILLNKYFIKQKYKRNKCNVGIKILFCYIFCLVQFFFLLYGNIEKVLKCYAHRLFLTEITTLKLEKNHSKIL